MSSCGPVADHVDQWGDPRTWADLALLDLLERDALEAARVDDDPTPLYMQESEDDE